MLPCPRRCVLSHWCQECPESRRNGSTGERGSSESRQTLSRREWEDAKQALGERGCTAAVEPAKGGRGCVGPGKAVRKLRMNCEEGVECIHEHRDDGDVEGKGDKNGSDAEHIPYDTIRGFLPEN